MYQYDTEGEEFSTDEFFDKYCLPLIGLGFVLAITASRQHEWTVLVIGLLLIAFGTLLFIVAEDEMLWLPDDEEM